MKENKPICATCRWSRKVKGTRISAFHCDHKYTIDPITGFHHFNPCRDYNSNGECDNWEQGGIKGFIQRLIKKNKIMVISIISICIAAVLITLIVSVKEYVMDKERSKCEEKLDSLREDNRAYLSLYHTMRAIMKDSSIVITEENKEKLDNLFKEADEI